MPATVHSIPSGLRLYAIGDIHGRDDLLGQLLEKIDKDAKEHKGKLRKIFLGDYLDRGLYSRQVIDRLIALRETEKDPPIFLLGNHEQVVRELLRGRNGNLLADWLRFGGRETLMSYGISVAPGNISGIVSALREKMPPPHVDFIERLETHAIIGDYFFCHAGVRPGVDLSAQDERDLVWIRAEFLLHKEQHPKMIVHGHTIAPEPELRPNRINLDTGAYATGRLTALKLEGNKKWLLQTK
jgi:serine/threonine protein phosphatase 1